MIRLLLIGFEHPNAHHYVECLRNQSEVKLAALAEPNNLRFHAEGNLLAGVPVFADYRTMLQEVPADGAIICSASARHKEMVIACARAKVSVLCEKPLATRTADAREMLAICEAHDVRIDVCFPARFCERLIQAKQLIEQGELGKILTVKASSRVIVPADWFVDPDLSGGGVIMEQGTLLLDAFRWLFQSEFVQVFGSCSSRLCNLAVEDAGSLTLHMGNEAIVTIDVGWCLPDKSLPNSQNTSVSIVGTRGVLDLEPLPWMLNFYSEKDTSYVSIGCDEDAGWRMLAHFVGALSQEIMAGASGVDGLRALEVAEAAYKSISTGTAVLL